LRFGGAIEAVAALVAGVEGPALWRRKSRRAPPAGGGAVHQPERSSECTELGLGSTEASHALISRSHSCRRRLKPGPTTSRGIGESLVGAAGRGPPGRTGFPQQQHVVSHAELINPGPAWPGEALRTQGFDGSHVPGGLAHQVVGWSGRVPAVCPGQRPAFSLDHQPGRAWAAGCSASQSCACLGSRSCRVGALLDELVSNALDASGKRQGTGRPVPVPVAVWAERELSAWSRSCLDSAPPPRALLEKIWPAYGGRCGLWRIRRTPRWGGADANTNRIAGNVGATRGGPGIRQGQIGTQPSKVL